MLDQKVIVGDNVPCTLSRNARGKWELEGPSQKGKYGTCSYAIEADSFAKLMRDVSSSSDWFRGDGELVGKRVFHHVPFRHTR